MADPVPKFIGADEHGEALRTRLERGDPEPDPARPPRDEPEAPRDLHREAPAWSPCEFGLSAEEFKAVIEARSGSDNSPAAGNHS